MNWVIDNKQWLFSGIGIVVLTLIYKLVRTFFLKPPTNLSDDIKALEHLKASTKILFIDDRKFKVPDILTKAGWTNTKSVRDINSLDEPEVENTDIFFVDIQGVGKIMGFSDEGLGLASAIKTRYPQKKLVIYSAENNGDRFHKALKLADASLTKNADPYEFLQLVEQFSREI